MPTTISHVFLQCDPPHLHRVERSVSLPLWTQVGPVPALTDRMGWVQLLAVSPWHPRAVLFQFTSAASDQNTVLYFLSERERALPARCPLVSSSVWLWGSVSLTQSSMVLGAWFAGHEIEPMLLPPEGLAWVIQPSLLGLYLIPLWLILHTAIKVLYLFMTHLLSISHVLDTLPRDWTSGTQNWKEDQK